MDVGATLWEAERIRSRVGHLNQVKSPCTQAHVFYEAFSKIGRSEKQIKILFLASFAEVPVSTKQQTKWFTISLSLPEPRRNPELNVIISFEI